MGYTAQFNLLSECYKKGEQPAGWHMGGVKVNPKKGTKAKKPTTKKVKKAKSSSKKQRGGSSCGASPSVSEMGVVDKPASLQATASELAWDNRMRGGANGNTVALPPTGNLLSSNPINTINKNKSVNSGNSPLNKIKNELFPAGTAPELVMKIIETNKNSINPAESTYSFEIFYRENGKTDIQKSSESNVKFGVGLNKYRVISEIVFPRPPKTNGKNTQAVQTAVPKANAVPEPAPAQAPAPAPAPAPANAGLLGGRKHKKNRK